MDSMDDKTNFYDTIIFNVFNKDPLIALCVPGEYLLMAHLVVFGCQCQC